MSLLIASSPSETLKSAYEKWNLLERCKADFANIYLPLRCSGDSGLHQAVYAKKKGLVKDLIALIVKNDLPSLHYYLSLPNHEGDTPLHVAASVGNCEAATCFVEKLKIGNMGIILLGRKNKVGETPIYRAARTGQAEVLQYFVSVVLKYIPQPFSDSGPQLPGYLQATEDIHKLRGEAEANFDNDSPHWWNNDDKPILHATLEGLHFETALSLIRFKPVLANMRDAKGRTALSILARLHHAFKSGSEIGIAKRFLYYMLPGSKFHKIKWLGPDPKQDVPAVGLNRVDEGSLKARNADVERGNIRTNNNNNNMKYFCEKLGQAYKWLCKRLGQGCPMIKKLNEEKRRNAYAKQTVDTLIKEENSVWDVIQGEDGESSNQGKKKHRPENTTVRINIDQKKHRRIMCKKYIDEDDEGSNSDSESEEDDHGPELGAKGENHKSKQKIYDEYSGSPLLMAASMGIIEIVEAILKNDPSAIETLTPKGRNILHVAILHRKKKILELLVKGLTGKSYKMMNQALWWRIDNDGNTILHQTGSIHFYRKGSRLGPALELQDELEWYDEKMKELPRHYLHYRNKRSLYTAWEFFEDTHETLRERAEKWLKETSQSCSVVAVLVATVVFAAAYTIPGGLDDRTKIPVFMDKPIFVVFTVMDTVSVSSALISVVFFLSILSSSYRFEDFRSSLPRKLTLGFIYLFFSVATTMLAFAVTIMLTIRSNKWTATLVYVGAFLPVFIFAMIQLPLFMDLLGTLTKRPSFF